GEAFLLARHDQAGGTHYYILKKGGDLPTELVQERRQVVQDGNVRSETLLPVFRGTLTAQFADCPAVLLRVSKTEYKESALVAVVEQYNACRQPGQPVATHTRPTEANLEVLLGGQISQTTYNDNQNSDHLSGALAPEIGVALRVGRRTAKQKVSLRLELHYVRQVATGTFERQTALPGLGQFLTTTYEARFKAAYLRLPVLVRYTLPGTKLRPFIEAGASLNYATQLDPQVRKVSDSKGAGPTDWYTLFSDNISIRDSFRHYEIGFLAGVGAQFAGIAGHPVAVLARVERSDGFMTVVSYSTPVVRGSLLLSFDLAKAKAK
ncbi:MAG: PorT family protein, partial [Hymenobacter sp.]